MMVLKNYSYVIAIDGPAASGKSSVSRKLAAYLDWNWVSTGAFYRGLGYVALEKGVDLEDSESLSLLARDRDIWRVQMSSAKTLVYFMNHDVTSFIQHEDVGFIASRISKLPKVREALLEAQRECLSLSENGLVAEGRDCGTVVFPGAISKIYLTANEESRALRRAQEQGAELQEIIKIQKTRDWQDKNRTVAPMAVAPEAHVLDSSLMSIEEVVQRALVLIQQDFKKQNLVWSWN